MSQTTRQWVVNRLQCDAEDSADLLNADETTTALIAFLQELLQERIARGVTGGIEVTAVRSDHPTWDGPNGHSGGNAIDFVCTDGAPEHLVADVQKCEGALGIGLGGSYQEYALQLGGYNEASKLFEDNSSDHIHVQVVGY